MIHDFQPGDFLIFQLESGYALLRVLAVDILGNDAVWHVAAYADLFLDTETADAAIQTQEGLTVEKPHIALTNRAFESTQVAKMANAPLTDEDLKELESWRKNGGEALDRSVRLILGLR